MKKWWGKKSQARQPRLMDGQDSYVFRRSRTLTGTTSSSVNPTAGERGQLKTVRLKLHQLRQQRLKAFRLLVGITAMVAMLTVLASTFVLQPQVGFVQASSKEPNSEAYSKVIQEYLGAHPLERLGFLLNAPELEKFVKSKHSEVRSLSVTKLWYGGDVGFTVGFRVPLLVWQTGGKQFYVDDQGVAFSYNNFANPTVVVTDQSGIPPEVSGGAVASSRFISFLGRMVGAINSYGKGRVVGVAIPASTRQIDLSLEGREYPIKTHSDRDPLEQAEDVVNALTFFDSKSIKPQYVDVRVAHKAFYK